MNKQYLYLFGGALMASTALSTSSHAATVKANAGDTAAPSASAITAKGLATQVFSATTATANSVSIGGGTTTAANHLLIDYAAQLSTPFNIQLDVVNASFTGTPTLNHYRQTTGGTLELLASVTGCSTQTLPDKILISSCDPTTSTVVAGAFPGGATRVDAIALVGTTYTSAAALAVAGSSITLSGTIRNTSNTVTFENITSANVVTSKSAIDADFAAGAAQTINNNATVAFSDVGAGPILTAQLGSVKFSSTASVGTDLSLVLTSSTVASATEIKITSAVLSDPAVSAATGSGATLGGTPAAANKTPAQFVSGTVSFTVAGASLAGATVSVTFNGTTAITNAAAGSATVTPTAFAPTVVPVTAFTGTTASFTRGGLSVELNTIMSTAGEGSTKYRSFIRVANTSAVSGSATVVVRNDNTGASIGTYTTGTIAAGATLQIGAADIETALPTALATGAPYKVTVGGNFNGYAQHLMWNSVTGIFTDLSGFRRGGLASQP